MLLWCKAEQICSLRHHVPDPEKIVIPLFTAFNEPVYYSNKESSLLKLFNLKDSIIGHFITLQVHYN
jgi:hypothetical protein